MSSAPKPICREVGPWLKANLHKGCLAGCTGVDSAALVAAVHILQTRQYADSKDQGPLLRAFGLVVMAMQPSCWHLAYHAIAMVGNWDERPLYWQAAGLPALANPGVCHFEPQSRGIVV